MFANYSQAAVNLASYKEEQQCSLQACYETPPTDQSEAKYQMHPAHFFKIENRIIPNSDFKMAKHFCLRQSHLIQPTKIINVKLLVCIFCTFHSSQHSSSADLEDLKVERLRESVEIRSAGKSSLLMIKRAPS